uniref:Uncharacterized protein n=1 Tax=Oryza rufipogon TaxID=4529 RepID=A0A0E0Q2R4_ORYRU
MVGSGGYQLDFCSLSSSKQALAYVEELEKEVRRLVDDNLNLKKQCKEITGEQEQQLFSF